MNWRWESIKPIKYFKLFYVSNSYIEYLLKYEKRVPYNKNGKRPYIGIVYTYNGINYFAPLSSPKEKHLKIKSNQPDVFKIKNGELGIVNINNMIPTPEECLIEAIYTIEDEKYKKLLENQLSFINKPINRYELIKKVNYFQKRYRENNLPSNIIERTCNFKILEEKYSEWKNFQNN